VYIKQVLLSLSLDVELKSTSFDSSYTQPRLLISIFRPILKYLRISRPRGKNHSPSLDSKVIMSDSQTTCITGSGPNLRSHMAHKSNPSDLLTPQNNVAPQSYPASSAPGGKQHHVSSSPQAQNQLDPFSEQRNKQGFVPPKNQYQISTRLPSLQSVPAPVDCPVCGTQEMIRTEAYGEYDAGGTEKIE